MNPQRLAAAGYKPRVTLNQCVKRWRPRARAWGIQVLFSELHESGLQAFFQQCYCPARTDP